MKTFFIILLGLMAFLLVMALLTAIGMAWWSKNNPPSLGLHNETLRPCPSTPNCVCSEAPTANILPLSIKGMPEEHALQRLIAAIQHAGGNIEKQSETYLWATFKTPLLGYVDDVEARIDKPNSLIHLRSASRVGHSDFTQNQQRIARIRQHFNSL